MRARKRKKNRTATMMAHELRVDQELQIMRAMKKKNRTATTARIMGFAAAFIVSPGMRRRTTMQKG